MLKRIFITLLIIIASSNGLFAKSNNEANAKNSNELRSAPHFDLPKKDSKEQCAEVERVYEECRNEIKLSESEASFPVNVGGVIASQDNGGVIEKCGNIYLISSSYLTDACTSMLIINDRGQYVGIKKRCDKWKDIEYFYMDGGYIGMIYDEKEKQKKGATILKTRNCHIISSFNNY